MKIHLNQSKRDISWKKFRFRRFRIRKNMRWTRYRSETKRKPYSSAYTTKYSQRTPPKDLKEMVTKVKDEENDSVHALVRSPPVAVPTPPSQVSSPFKNNKVNSLQEACVKCFAVYILKFEILQTSWKNKKTSKC